MGDAFRWLGLNEQEPVSTIAQPGSVPGATEPTDLLLLDPLMGSWSLSQLQPDHCGTFAICGLQLSTKTVSSSRGGVVLTSATGCRNPKPGGDGSLGAGGGAERQVAGQEKHLYQSRCGHQTTTQNTARPHQPNDTTKAS